MATFLGSPHPLLKEPILYVADPPDRGRLKWKHLVAFFSPCCQVTSGGRKPLSTNPNRQKYVIKFPDLFHTEMALATLQGTAVTQSSPPWTAHLSHSPELESSLPPKPLLRQFVKSSVNPHPHVHNATLQTIFRWFRNAGPLVSVETNVAVGDPQATVVVEYWKEEHAAHAKAQAQAIHPSLQGGPAFTLRTFDRTTLFCTGLSFTFNKGDLSNYFSKFGAIREIHLHNAGSTGLCGFVCFSNTASADKAIHATNRAMVAGRQITVRYYEPSIQEVFRTGFADSPLSAKQSHEGGGPVPASDSKSNSGTAQADARQKQQAAAFKRQMEAEEARIKAKREAAQARLKRRDERQRLKEVAQHNEQLARRRVEDALQEEYQANVEFVYTQSKCDKADKYLNESEQAAATAKRLWLEAMDREAEAVRQAQEAREDRAKSMSRKDYAETSRRAAEAHEWTFRRARERIEQEEEEEEEVDEETLRWLELEESIRKMEELRRIEKAGREEKAKQEKSKQDAEVAEEARKQEDARRQEEQRQAREREAAERIVREKREREEQERRDAASRELLYRQAALAERNRCLRRDLTSFPASANLFQWTPQLALDRFVFVSDEFDTINFGNTQPLTFESVPWPILPSPRQMTLEAIEWGAVERFFAAAAKIMDNPDEYRTVLAKARLRFHPDRWRGRGILNTVLEDELRNRLEAAGNIVAQAITPLWLEAKQQS